MVPVKVENYSENSFCKGEVRERAMSNDFAKNSPLFISLPKGARDSKNIFILRGAHDNEHYRFSPK